MILTKKTWWHSTPIIAICFALWFLIIPAILGIFLMYKQYKHSKEVTLKLSILNTINNLDEQIENREKIVDEIKQSAKKEGQIISDEIKNQANLDARNANKNLITSLEMKEQNFLEKEKNILEEQQKIILLKSSIVEDASDELNEINNKITIQENNIETNSAELAKLKKEIDKYIRQARKFRSDAISLQNIHNSIGKVQISWDEKFLSKYEEHKNPLILINDNELLESVSTLYTHSDHSKQLRKLSTATKKEIKNTLTVFLDRYQTKTIKSMYSLMVIGLQSEIQLILSNLTFESIDDSLDKVDQLIEKYSLISSKGNQSILNTVLRFLSTMQVYYKELVNIEYKYYVKREKEKEEQRFLRQQMKEEAAEQKALKEEQRKLKREEDKFKTELDRATELLQNEHDEDKLTQLKNRIAELEQQMDSIEERKESIATLANGKAGYVYIISNVGSFGDNVFKIGMTRRLEPQDRVDELGSASVPFRFDVHAFIFSQDAVGLEFELHQKLSNYRINKVNYRKEFFKTSVESLELLVEELDPTAEFNETILALEYKQTLALEKELNEEMVLI